MECRLSAACLCNMGRVRGNNEDNFYFDGRTMPLDHTSLDKPLLQDVSTSPFAAFGVFDGMGGEANGEQAALLCAQTLHRCSSDEPFDALDFFRRANVAVCDMIAASGQIGGSTAATVHLTGNRAYCCNVGDSRIYLMREGRLTPLTRDHSEVALMVAAGCADDAPPAPDAPSAPDAPPAAPDAPPAG